MVSPWHHRLESLLLTSGETRLRPQYEVAVRVQPHIYLFNLFSPRCKLLNLCFKEHLLLLWQHLFFVVGFESNR